MCSGHSCPLPLILITTACATADDRRFQRRVKPRTGTRERNRAARMKRELDKSIQERDHRPLQSFYIYIV
jgi:hypothetical protein